MAINRHTTVDCEMCGTLLEGKSGTVWVNKPHIAIQGSMSVQFYDEVEGHQHYYITRNREDIHHFCNFQCLQDYSDIRKRDWERARERRLRREASEA